MTELDFYQLQEEPFEDTADPKYLYMSQSHREAMASLYYGVESGQGFQALIAPAGMGKTTLLFRVMERWRGTTRTVFLIRHGCDSQQLLELVGDSGADEGEQDPAEAHARLRHVFGRESQAGRRFVILLDEAQSLDDSTLDTVGLLADVETPHSQFLQIVLVGRPELDAKLARAAFVRLRRRIAFVTRLRTLGAEETAECVRHRLVAAGHATGDLFTAQAAALIARASGGAPGEICRLAHSALQVGYILERRVIDIDVVRQFVSDADVEALLLESVPAPIVDPGTDTASSSAGTPSLTSPESETLVSTHDEVASPPAPAAEPEPGTGRKVRKEKAASGRSKKSRGTSARSRKPPPETPAPPESVDPAESEPAKAIVAAAQTGKPKGPEPAASAVDVASADTDNGVRRRSRRRRGRHGERSVLPAVAAKPQAVVTPEPTEEETPAAIGLTALQPEAGVAHVMTAEPEAIAGVVAASETEDEATPTVVEPAKTAEPVLARESADPAIAAGPHAVRPHRLTEAEIEAWVLTSFAAEPPLEADTEARFAAALAEWGGPVPVRAPVVASEPATKPQATPRLSAVAVLSAIGYQPAPPPARRRNTLLGVVAALLAVGAVLVVLSARGRGGNTAGDSAIASPPGTRATPDGRGQAAGSPANAPVSAPASTRVEAAPARPGETPSVDAQPPATGAKIWRGPTEGAPTQVVVVRPNQTLEQVCREYLGRWDMEVLREVRRLNPEVGDLNLIQAGQRLRLPS